MAEVAIMKLLLAHVHSTQLFNYYSLLKCVASIGEMNTMSHTMNSLSADLCRDFSTHQNIGGGKLVDLTLFRFDHSRENS